MFFTKNAWFKWKHPRAFVAIKARIVEKEYASSEAFVAETQKRLSDTHAHVRRFSVMNKMDLAALASPKSPKSPTRLCSFDENEAGVAGDAEMDEIERVRAARRRSISQLTSDVL